LSKEPWASIKGYLLVPGLEQSETRAFIPRTTASMGKWVIGHPLEGISHYTRDFDWVPPRCLIPGYPDDPKSRFRDELDEEVSKQKQAISAWKSVRSLEQFWEMMAFRQECSSGRLTGFVWLVFDPSKPPLSSSPTTMLTTPNASFDSSLPPVIPATPPRRRVGLSSSTPRSSPLKAPASPTAPASLSPKPTKKKAKKKPSGRIIPRAPRVKTQARSYLADRPTATAYYFWPAEGRGDKLVEEAEYKRIVELLLHLDFSTLNKAVGSSRRWLNEVGIGDSAEGDIVGRAVVPASLRANGTAADTATGSVTNLTGLIRRKNMSVSARSDAGRPSAPAANEQSGLAAEPATKVNILGAGLVRKRKKEAGGT